MKRKSNGCFFIFKSPHERNPRQSRILDFTPWIPDPCTRVHTLCPWNLDSVFYLLLDSEAQDSWIPRAYFPGSRIPQVRM